LNCKNFYTGSLKRVGGAPSKTRLVTRRPATHTRLLTEFERSLTDFLQKKEAKEAAAAAIRPVFQLGASRREERPAQEEEEEPRESNVDTAATSIIDVSTLKRKKVCTLTHFYSSDKNHIDFQLLL
jgi:hypothetical protein